MVDTLFDCVDVVAVAVAVAAGIVGCVVVSLESLIVFISGFNSSSHVPTNSCMVGSVRS